MSVLAQPSTKSRRSIHLTEAITAAVIALAMIAVHLMFYFWPFRYRQVHPLLERIFESRVVVAKFHRTYFPHPGFVAEGVRFFRHGDTRIPPLATVERMTVAGQWGMLLFHPHLLYEIRLEGLHVQIPPAGTHARGMDFDNGVIDTSQSKLRVETICADGTVLDFLRSDQGPVRFLFPRLGIHDLQAGKPMQFAMQVAMPGPRGTVAASGQMGPFRTSSYMTTPLKGTYRLESADLSRLQGLSGHAEGGGGFAGVFSRIAVKGTASIPDFRAGSAHRVGMEAAYQVTVNGTNADIAIDDASVRTGSSVVTAHGTVAGSPRTVAVTIEAQGAQLEDLLKVVEQAEPQLRGKVNFAAAAEFAPGPRRFLERLHLRGEVAVEGVHLVDAAKQEKIDAFSAREQKDDSARAASPALPSAAAPLVGVDGQTETRIEDGVAHFPDIHAGVPGADAHLHGTFNLLDTRIHLTGTVALEKGISHAVTGWRALLLKPLTPFFRKKDAGAVAPVAVTGTAANPKVGADLFHDK